MGKEGGGGGGQETIEKAPWDPRYYKSAHKEATPRRSRSVRARNRSRASQGTE